MKKQWTKPELIVLVRGPVEESVLCHCKRGDGWSGPYCGSCPSTTRCQDNSAS